MVIKVGSAILYGLISSTSPARIGQVETNCDVMKLSPYDTSGYFSIADTDSIKPIDKHARKVHVDSTRAAQALDGEYNPGAISVSKWPIETFTFR